MGCEAEIIAIGPSQNLAQYDALAYPESFYDLSKNGRVMGYLAKMSTTSGSEALATLCCVGLWDLDNHIVTEIDHQGIDWEELFCSGFDERFLEPLEKCVKDPQVEVWFLPCG